MIEFIQVFLSMEMKSPRSLRQISISLPFLHFLLLSFSFGLPLLLAHNLEIYGTSQNNRMP